MENNRSYRKISEKADIQAAMALFNSCADNGEVLYKRFDTEAAFERFFLHREDGVRTISIVESQYDGFASGCLNEQGTKGYVTFVAVQPERRRQGVGRELLHALEEQMRAMAGEKLESFEASFFNPMNFVWIVPGTDGHEHPNAPGVDVAGSGYLFLKNCGYRDFAYQNSYHLNLQGYQMTEDVARKEETLREKGIQITYYDSEKHTGLEETLVNLNNDMWYKEIMAVAAKKDGPPLLIVDWNGKAMGFTGPLYVQENGRGYLAGVGIHSDCRGNGAGKVLFGRLCTGLRDLGAKYMTLFTGETNPARNIYEAQGFKIVRTWADMHKQAK